MMQDGPLCPALPIDVTGPSGKTVPVLGLVDSGADASMFPVEWASPFGIDLSKCISHDGTGAGGSCEYLVWTGSLTGHLLGVEFPLSASFSTGVPIVLLGRQDFFARFEVTFNHNDETFSLRPFSAVELGSKRRPSDPRDAVKRNGV